MTSRDGCCAYDEARNLDFVADKQEWNGTAVRFDILEEEGGTRVVFTHDGLTTDDDCYDICTNAWGMFVNGSLKARIDTSKGAPYVFGGDEELTAADHDELHSQVAAAAADRVGGAA
jgi:hypothetical protein